MWKASNKWKGNMMTDFREVISEDGRLVETYRSSPVEDIIIIIIIVIIFIIISVKCNYCELRTYLLYAI
jgi:hypothetical protein